MTRIATALAFSAFALSVTALVPGTGSADAAYPPGSRPATFVDVGPDGAQDADIGPDGLVVFRNPAHTPARIVFQHGDAEDVDCSADGNRTTRSRAGQYTLMSGAELACAVSPGSYRYTTVTQRSGAVHEARSRLHVLE